MKPILIIIITVIGVTAWAPISYNFLSYFLDSVPAAGLITTYSIILLGTTGVLKAASYEKI
jgi:hypothetical protein